MKMRIWYVLAVLMVLLSVTACGAPATTSAPPTSVPQAVVAAPTLASVATATTAPKVNSPTAVPAKPTEVTKSQSTATGKLDIDKLLPNAPGRDLTLEYCVGCHHIAAIAIAAKPKDEWQAHRLGHVGRTIVPDAILDKIYAYLMDNYPPDRKIPELPPELLGDWTSY